jgi:hypothetical protein
MSNIQKASINGQDLTGLVFGRLTVVGYSHSQKWSRYWLCKCECGNSHTTKTKYLTNGDTKSCGCKFGIKHGFASRKLGRPREYSIWKDMKKRCRNKSSKNYRIYGGRGITVCDRWETSYINFISDMGPSPSKNHSIDRIDVNGNYEPGNCKWSTVKEQSLNKTNTLMATIKGVSKPVREWCIEYGINYELVRHRITSYKWEPELALSTPPKTMRNGKKFISYS